jgi:tRNA A37 methylthiotransferase MiaB
VHLPAQSGNDDTLARMGRGHTRDAYLRLVDDVRAAVPGVALTSDFIAGFCDETDAAHADTVSLMRQVRYSMAYCFAYSMREVRRAHMWLCSFKRLQGTRAHRRLVDNVDNDVKLQRVNELHAAFAAGAAQLNAAAHGENHLVLVDGVCACTRVS